MKYIAIALLLIVVATTGHYQVWSQQLEIPALDTTEAVAQDLIDRKLIPGIAYAIILNGEISEVRVLGSADLETGQALELQTLFESASLTKPIIVEIARRLHEQGLFDLDEAVAETIDNPRAKDARYWSEVTPRHLLSHRAGYPNWSGDSRDPDRSNSLEPNFRPGTDFDYSGEGYGLLLEFLEAKAGRSMIALSDELFADLGMTSSTLVAANLDGDFARGHWIVEPGRQAWRTSRPIAAYSLFTNAPDYGRFLQHVMQVYKTEQVFSVHEPTFEIFANGDSLAWSLGWGVLLRGESQLHFQWGDNGPFKALAMFDAEKGNGIVYFCNGSLGTVFADELSRPVLGDIRSASEWFSNPILEYFRRHIGL